MRPGPPGAMTSAGHRGQPSRPSEAADPPGRQPTAACRERLGRLLLDMGGRTPHARSYNASSMKRPSRPEPRGPRSLALPVWPWHKATFRADQHSRVALATWGTTHRLPRRAHAGYLWRVRAAVLVVKGDAVANPGAEAARRTDAPGEPDGQGRWVRRDVNASAFDAIHRLRRAWRCRRPSLPVGGAAVHRRLKSISEGAAVLRRAGTQRPSRETRNEHHRQHVPRHGWRRRRHGSRDWGCCVPAQAGQPLTRTAAPATSDTFPTAHHRQDLHRHHATCGRACRADAILMANNRSMQPWSQHHHLQPRRAVRGLAEPYGRHLGATERVTPDTVMNASSG